VPLDVNTLPVVPAATVDKAVPPALVIATELPVNDAAPVPPLATGKCLLLRLLNLPVLKYLPYWQIDLN